MVGTSRVIAPDDIQAIRADFPYLDECVYLNTAAAGLSWNGEGRAAALFYDKAKQRGMNGMSIWRETGARARARLSDLLQVHDDEIRFVSSTTEGLNLAIGAVEWRPGDEVVFAKDEFPSVVLACEAAGKAGARLRPVDVKMESDRESALLAALTPATRVLAVSHVHWVTGTRVDLRRMSAACHHALGTMLFVDGIQAIGAVPTDLGETDVYCASVFKWLLSGFGLAVLVVRERVQADLAPRIRGYNNPPPSTDLAYSHVNYPGLYALAASLEYLESRIGWETVYRRVALLARELSDGLRERGYVVATPADACAGIVSCRVPDPSAVKEWLAKNGVFVEAREGLLRVSPHFYNTSDDLRSFFDALVKIPRQTAS
jgi:selenocysteine lyase/cysteine desulfurase